MSNSYWSIELKRPDCTLVALGLGGLVGSGVLWAGGGGFIGYVCVFCPSWNGGCRCRVVRCSYLKSDSCCSQDHLGCLARSFWCFRCYGGDDDFSCMTRSSIHEDTCVRVDIRPHGWCCPSACTEVFDKACWAEATTWLSKTSCSSRRCWCCAHVVTLRFTHTAIFHGLHTRIRLDSEEEFRATRRRQPVLQDHRDASGRRGAFLQNRNSVLDGPYHTREQAAHREHSIALGRSSLAGRTMRIRRYSERGHWFLWMIGEACRLRESRHTALRRRRMQAKCAGTLNGTWIM